MLLILGTTFQGSNEKAPLDSKSSICSTFQVVKEQNKGEMGMCFVKLNYSVVRLKIYHR